MLPGPNIVRECHSCHEYFIQASILSGNTFGAKFWPDGKMEAPMMPNAPAYVGCPHCKTSFWIEDTKEVGQYKWGEKNTNTFANAISYIEPSDEIYLQGLKDSNLTKDREIYLRANLMRLYNDVNRDQKTQKPSTEAQKNNWTKLIEILEAESTEDKLLKAEVYREMGDFNQAKKTLQGEFDEDYMQSLDVLDKLIEARDHRVMCINPEDH